MAHVIQALRALGAAVVLTASALLAFGTVSDGRCGELCTPDAASPASTASTVNLANGWGSDARDQTPPGDCGIC